MKTKKITMMLCIAIMALPLMVRATSMFAVSLEKLSTDAEMIVQAKVTAVVTQWNRDTTQILTYVRMNIDDDMFGENEDNEIIIQQPGGSIGTLTMEVEGTTSYRVGDENVLFLFKDFVNKSTYQTIGMYQGKYRIFTDANNVRRVSQDVDTKVMLYKRAADGDVIETGNNMALDEFKTTIFNYRTAK